MAQSLTSFDPVLKDLQEKKMPAVSKRQRRAVAIAKNHPDQLFARNRGLLKMSAEDKEHFASTSEKGLPESKTKKAMKRVMARS